VGGMWRFRWAVRVGVNNIQVNCKQEVNGSPRPSMIVKANPDVGLNSDTTASAGSSTGWVVIGPITVTATAVGPVWVELHNNYQGAWATPAFFDHIVAY
jgi:hypothetical protein